MRKVTVGVLWAALAIVPAIYAQGQADAKAGAAPADVEALKKQRADLEPQRKELDAQLNARRQELAKQEAVATLRDAADKADKAFDEALKSDTKLAELRKAEESARQAIENVRQKVAKADPEGQTVGKEIHAINYKDTMLDHDQRLNDYMLQNDVTRRLYESDAEVSAARAKVWEAEQKARNIENSDAELVEVRGAREAARVKYEKVLQESQPAELIAARKAHRDAEQAYRQAVQSSSASVELQKAREAADGVVKGKLEADKEAIELRNLRADLEKQRAKIDYEISLVNFKLQSGVARRVEWDPEVGAARERQQAAENAFRLHESTNTDILALRKAMEAARKTAEELGQAQKSNKAVADAAEALEKANQGYEGLRNVKLGALRKELDELRQKEKAVLDAKLAASGDAKTLAEARAKAGEERAAGSKAREKAEQTWRAVLDRVYKEHPDVQAAIKAQADAKKAYDDAYAQSNAAKLEQERRAARDAANGKMRELTQADAQCAELTAKARDLDKKAREVDAQIAEASKPKAQ